MTKPVLGVLGGMGGLASAEFVKTIYELSGAESHLEQDEPALVMYSDPAFPDRTEAFLRGETQLILTGLIDIPFSPSVHNRGEVMTTRDVEGAVRFLSFGNLQLDRETRQFHADKVSERRLAEGIHSRLQDPILVERDVLQVACCRYDHWPLSQ